MSKLLEIRRMAREKGWIWLAKAMDTVAGIGFVLSGHIQEGLGVLEEVVVASDADGDRTRATLGRIFLAEVYLGILEGKRAVPLRVILRNLNVLVQIKLFGARRAFALLEQASQNDQLHENGTIRARINMNIGLLHKINLRPRVAREFLEKARSPAELQGNSFMVGKIDAALASL
jgi:hypothetical protein